MGIFSSSSSSGKHHRNAHYGANHYKKTNILGKIFDLVTSRSHSHNYYNQNNNYSHSFPNQIYISCPKCNSRVPDGSKFCLQCGEKINTPQFCNHCGKKILPNTKFCSECGTKVNV